MTKILMVCLGNICRSPLAEGIMQHKIEEKGLNATVDSAGTAAYHIGEPADRRSVLTAKKHGIDITKLRGRQFEVSDFDEFDLIYVMDESNYENLKIMARNDADMAKVDYIMNMVSPGENKIVPDPYYGGDMGFENVYNLLDAAAEEITKKLEQ